MKGINEKRMFKKEGNIKIKMQVQKKNQEKTKKAALKYLVTKIMKFEKNNEICENNEAGKQQELEHGGK